MKTDFIKEPSLVFGKGKHICPRMGITEYDVYDTILEARKKDFLLGIVAIDEDVEKLNNWLKSCQGFIKASKIGGQVNLNVNFPGFNVEKGFCSNFIYSNEITRRIAESDIADILKEKNREKRILKAVDIFYNHCRFLSEDKKVDIIICVIPESFESTIVTEKNIENVEEKIDEEVEVEQEINFRRALKAKCLQFDSPLQLIREYVLSEGKKIQDKATIAWNFCTGIYYKAMQTIPWKLDRDKNLPPACFVGVSFYKSRDKTTIQTSLAQVFNENGNGIILRGTPVEKDKEDRIPHLTYQQSYDLLDKALEHYHFAVSGVPGRLVLHKTSKFYDDELSGFEDASKKYKVAACDFISVQETNIRFFRNGLYPPNRGTMITLEENQILLYTRGSVQYYQTYPGMYIPAPLLLRVVKRASSNKTICHEILGLTKMNWNNTQFDGKYPITIGCARKVGEILKYLKESDKPKTKYAYYM
jgi:hypothetical protein